MTKRLDIVLHSDYPPETSLAKLSNEMDIDQWTLFSLSGYAGYAPVLGRISGNEFRLHKRHRSHNSFGPVLFGRVLADGRGSLVEAYWATWPVTRLFMRTWVISVAAVGTPVFLITLQDLIRHGFAGAGNWGVGLAVPLGLAVLGLLLPRFGAAMGSHEKSYLVEFLERVLVASPSPRASRDGNWESFFERL